MILGMASLSVMSALEVSHPIANYKNKKDESKDGKVFKYCIWISEQLVKIEGCRNSY